MSAWIEPRSEVLAVVNAKVALAAWATAKLHLYKNDFTPTPDTVIGDLVECDFSGYAAQSVTWSAAFYDQNGVAVSSAGALLFIQTLATVSNLCYGAFLTDAAGAVLLGSARLDAPPFGFNGPDVALELAMQLAAEGGVLITVVGP